MRYILSLLVVLLFCPVNALSEESSHNKTITQKEQKTEQKTSAAEVKPAPVEQLESIAVQDTGKKTDTHTDEKLEIDRKLAEYTRKLSIYTEALSDYTLWLVVATIVLGGIGAYQGWQLRKTVRLARDEFNATHRPRIRVRRVALERDKEKRVSYVVANVGDSPAYITGGMANLVYRPRILGLPNLQKIEGITINSETLGPGGQHNFYIVREEVMQEFQSEHQLVHPDNHTRTLYCYGFIKYTDDLGAIRETGFCRAFKSDNFVRTDNADYEYED